MDSHVVDAARVITNFRKPCVRYKNHMDDQCKLSGHILLLFLPIQASWRVSKEQSIFQIEFPYHDLKEEEEAALLRLLSDSDSGGEPNTVNGRSKIQIPLEGEDNEVQA